MDEEFKKGLEEAVYRALVRHDKERRKERIESAFFLALFIAGAMFLLRECFPHS